MLIVNNNIKYGRYCEKFYCIFYILSYNIQINYKLGVGCFMKTFEELISKAKGAVDVLGEKAGQFMDVSKLNLKLLELKTELKSELETLGKIVYDCTDEKILENPEVKTQVQSIKNLKQEIENLKTQIAFVKNKILCKSCGNYNEIKSLYCANCGASLKNNQNNNLNNTENNNNNFSQQDITNNNNINNIDNDEDDFAEFDD